MTPPSVSKAVRMNSHRLENGGMIDRARPLRFTFDGQAYSGFEGDTMASALMANGVRLVARSFKYHRPRGILTAGAEEPNALVELRAGNRREPNTRATTAELYEGLQARSQNRWPSLRHDLLALNAVAAPILGAGFYYKTFMWPAAFWEKVYEPLIRRAAGLGRGAGVEDPDTYEKAYLHCDVLVVGGGPTGLMAALAAGRTGARVVVCEEDFRLGGRLIADRRIIADQLSTSWVAGIEAELEALPEVRIFRRTTVAGAYDGGAYMALERLNDHVAEPLPHEPRQILWRIQAKRVVLAAGAIERPLVFGDNDRPGVVMAGAVRTYLNRFGVGPGRRAVVFATNDEAARTLADLADRGIRVEAIVDPRPQPSLAMAVAAKEACTELIQGGVVTRAFGAHGVQAAEVRTAAGEHLRLGCDLICVSGGWNPTLHLSTHQGARPIWNDTIAAFVPGDTPPGMTVGGAARGALSLDDALRDGARLGLEAASDTGFRGQQVDVPETDEESTNGAPLWRVRGSRGKAFIDLQNDVTDTDIEMAKREGFRSVEHLKRYTTLGMATDQGKTANVNGLAVMADLTAATIPQTGSTRARPPFSAVSFGALAGHARGKHFRPTRLTPTHAWAKAQGAEFVETGAWLRAQWFPQAGENDWQTSVDREVRAVRAGVGVCEVSTLGKIDVQGADALAFLEQVYANNLASLKVGRARYGLMLREDGFVLDDGTVARLGPERFVLTTTTANAAKVLQHMEFCQQWLWPALDVHIASVSEQWAQLALAGPKSREVLRGIVARDHDVLDVALPHLAVAEMSLIGGIPARVFRLTYSGERAYEIAVPSGFGPVLIERIMEAGRVHGITPYGTEAMGVMRIEKGHVAGNELNGQTTAHDLGLGRMLSGSKDYIGRALAQRPALCDPTRPRLVGLKPVDPGARPRAGAHLLPVGCPDTAAFDQGYVTSVAHSPALGCWIALALLARGPERHGEQIRAVDPVRGGDTLVEVCAPVFHDPQGAKHHG
jgi:methylglutamate dehydrogenase subunit C